MAKSVDRDGENGEAGPPALPPSRSKPRELVKRHRLSTRLWHWTNAIAIIVLLMSGLSIFNAHPRLYWGSYGANPDAPWLQISNERRKYGR